MGEGRGPLVGRGRESPVAVEADGSESPSAPGPTDFAGRLPRPAFTEPHRWTPGRVRLGSGIALVVVLAGAWIALAPHANPAAVVASARPSTSAPAPAAPTTSSSPPATTRTRPVPVPSWVPPAIASTCRAHSTPPPTITVVDCTPGRGVVQLHYRAFASVAALRAAYGHGSRKPEADAPSRCALGDPDERSWSTAAQPDAAVGRYRCGLTNGRARIVWTDERARVLAIAVRADGDLRSLYAWWTTVPGPVPSAAAR